MGSRLVIEFSTVSKPKGEQGAPAALKAIEEHELRCREEKDEARTIWKSAQANRVEGDEVSERAENRTRRQYLEALETWDDATKKLALFDKQILPEKREGEKLLKADAESFFTSMARHLRVGLEQTIISVSQDAMQCATPEAFYGMAANRFRSTFNESMNTARNEGHLPKWCGEALSRGL